MAVKTVEIDSLTNGQLYGFRMFPRNLKGQFQTRDDKGTATATPKAFNLPTYTGEYAIFGNETEGRIEMYTSGTLTLSPATYDIFAVGAGGGGGGSYYAYTGSSGGGGGYTTTIKEIKIADKLNVIVGTGGFGSLGHYSPSGGTGGDTVITFEETEIKAIGGQGSVNNTPTSGGGSGGSGGGGGGDISSGGSGGSDGSDGSSRVFNGGKGQGTTTRAFGETNGTLYAGGGGGGGGTYQGSYAGGSGGGGGGGGGGGLETGTLVSGKDGAKNTGGGGGGSPNPNKANYLDGGSGGSGIAIIRWKRN